MDDILVARIVIFVTMVGSGILLTWVAYATATGRLKRNSFAGIRIRSTMASDDAWLAAHARAKRANVLAGIAAIASGLSALLPVSEGVLAASVLAGAMVMTACVLYGARVGSRAAAEATNIPHN